MNRRAFVGLVAAGGSSVAGCLGSGSSDERSTESPTPTRTPIGQCPDGLERIDPWWTVEQPPVGGFDLTLSSESVPRGGTLTARLRNVTLARQETGNDAKYDVQRQTDDGWQSIFFLDMPTVWTDEAVGHFPTQGFTWELTATRRGLSRLDRSDPSYFVCEPLATGTYRFVYFGVVTETDEAPGVEFSITET